MLCSETGSHEAIHLPKEVVILASELHDILTAIEVYGHGRGQISMSVEPGRNIPFIDWTFRKFRRKNPSA